jgi:Ca2+-binding EF-hand superfamily protein
LHFIKRDPYILFLFKKINFHQKDLKAAFTMFDKNGDQKISANELLQVMQYLGLSASEKDVKAMIQVVDKNSMNDYCFLYKFEMSIYKMCFVTRKWLR